MVRFDILFTLMPDCYDRIVQPQHIDYAADPVYHQKFCHLEDRNIE